MSKTNEITIKRVDNGFVVNGFDTFEVSETISVFQEIDNPMLALQEMLYYVAEFTGYSYDGFGKNNLRVSIDEVGDEVEVEYETIELELDDETFMKLSTLAHESDLTLNQMVVKILEQEIEGGVLDDDE